MRVQAGHHARDGFGNELFLIHRLDIVALDHAKHRRELLKLFQWQRREGSTGHGLQLHRGQGPGHRANSHPAHDFQLVTHLFTHRNTPKKSQRDTIWPAGEPIYTLEHGRGFRFHIPGCRGFPRSGGRVSLCPGRPRPPPLWPLPRRRPGSSS